ncbi:Restriction of telomere capping protein 5 [Erysiphe neolycopersici]|uniref:Restriction of telomere capping protein 5 n=1 Tax=Erysiphe neolycopersici TaxID=212602 RepID=A0A420HXI8_9PEZI|nr:Restriction of telomere capping protein 5 [Erysiphe neolycopersici]
MGQNQSSDDRSHFSKRQLRHELASKFAKRCFTSIELYSFHEVFRNLADQHNGTLSISESAIIEFLQIPHVLGVSSTIFQMLSYIGSFPFCQDAPNLLGFDEMIIIIVILTQRYQRILRTEKYCFTKFLFRSLSIHENYESLYQDVSHDIDCTDLQRHNVPSIKDRDLIPEHGVMSKESDGDSLALDALELLGASHVFKPTDIPISHTSIPPDNLKKILLLLILIAPLENQQYLSSYPERLTGDHFKELRRTADNILAAFINVEKSPGIMFHQFETVISVSLPLLFNGFISLFEKFLFSKDIDPTKRDEVITFPSTTYPDINRDRPLLPVTSDIMDLNRLSQLSFFLPTLLSKRLHLLYMGSDAGFSLGSFETRVFNWRAPTILLVYGSRISEPPLSGKEYTFVETLPPKRFPSSTNSSRLVFGVYLTEYWRQSYQKCFGNSETLLFQLEPVHEVFNASSINTEYVAFNKKTTGYQGITIGCSHTKTQQISGPSANPNLGSVSLLIDSSFEFGVFTHDYTSGGGAFHNSQTRKFNWQDRFEIEGLEVWGCGDDTDAQKQKERWLWEEREAEARRRINLGSGDIESDRALLELAGLINNNRSGGSMS